MSLLNVSELKNPTESCERLIGLKVIHLDNDDDDDDVFDVVVNHPTAAQMCITIFMCACVSINCHPTPNCHIKAVVHRDREAAIRTLWASNHIIITPINRSAAITACVNVSWLCVRVCVWNFVVF